MLQINLKHLITAVILYFGVVSTAQATVLLQIERLSDTHAVLSASGSLDVGPPTTNAHLIGIANPYTVAPPPVFTDIFNGPPTITNGILDVFFAAQSSAAHGLFGGAPGFYFSFGNVGDSLSVGDVLSGSLDLNLVGGATWAPVGTSGNVQWGVLNNFVNVGSWEIVSSTVPEPATLVLMGIGLAGLGFTRRKQA